MKIYLMRDWKFCEEFTENMIDRKMEELEGRRVETVDLPHTCKELPFHYFDEKSYQMVSAYQKSIYARETWKGKEVYLTFEAVGHQADVYVNGKHLYTHRNGYTAFRLNISKALKYGEENLLTVRVDSRESLNQPPFGYVIDYMTYGGIYRDAYLELKHPVHIEDIFLKPGFEESVCTNGMSGREIELYRAAGKLESELTFSGQALEAIREGRLTITQSIAPWREAGLSENIIEHSWEIKEKETISLRIPEVSLWDVEHPQLYQVTTRLLLDGMCADEIRTTTGFRTVEFRKDGCYLNGRKIKIRGLNRHQSFAYVGYAMPESMQRYDARILRQELAVNAVRTSHYPQSQYFIDECDRQGLLVFTEIPGWQHIGDEAWQELAVQHVREMVTQYRNHPSIMIWGVRINESADHDAFYSKTNQMAHRLDDTRQTGGVRASKRSSLLEDVYTYNDFVHSGENQGCEPKRKVTSDMEKPYLITEYNGHMYPTKAFDDEEHRMAHMIRHANILNAIAGEEEIAGGFGWCMFDYNTHKDFGSGDRICYHGVMDLFRNPKLAAAIYAAQGEETPVLELSSSMDIGEHPACSRGDTYLISNADAIRMYKNDHLIRTYTSSDSLYKNLAHGPILIDDYVGDAIENGESFKKKQAELVKYCLNSVAIHGMKVTPGFAWAAVRLMLFYHMNLNKAVVLYNKYIGDWGGASNQYRFEAIKEGEIVKTLVKAPMTRRRLKVVCSHERLQEGITYDVAQIRVRAVDENENILHYYQESVWIICEGPIEVIGPEVVPLRGGMTGVYVKTTGESGNAKVTFRCDGCEDVTVELQISKKKMKEVDKRSLCNSIVVTRCLNEL